MPVQPGWSPSGAYDVTNGPDTQSAPFDPALWDRWMTELLALDGLSYYTINRMTLHFNGESDKPGFLDSHGMAVSDNLTVTFPGGAGYTVDVGFVRRSLSTDRV